MNVEFLEKFYKDLDDIPPYIKSNVFEVIQKFENANTVLEISNIKRLTGHKYAYRVRVGDFRIGLFIKNNMAEFARIVHRKDIYKVFP